MSNRTRGMLNWLTVFVAALIPTIGAIALFALVIYREEHPLAQTVIQTGIRNVALMICCAVAWFPWLAMVAVMIERDRRNRVAVAS